MVAMIPRPLSRVMVLLITVKAEARTDSINDYRQDDDDGEGIAGAKSRGNVLPATQPTHGEGRKDGMEVGAEKVSE